MSNDWEQDCLQARSSEQPNYPATAKDKKKNKTKQKLWIVFKNVEVKWQQNAEG
jgi:hypothetical protein